MARGAALFVLLALPCPADVQERELLEQSLNDLRSGLSQVPPDLRPDAEIFAKGVAWALRYESSLGGADLALVKKALERGGQRLRALREEKPLWTGKRGKLVRGFVSAVDGSVQPFGVIVPSGYDPTKPIRLDVVLHGSSKPGGMSELRFMNRFDEGDEDGKSPSDQPYIEVHPLGRVENCYRWSGETDVFEAIEAVSRRYAIDRDRIVLRGMSMGASGTWHLGLKHPDVFVALGPYCGYVDTHRFSQTPGMNFTPVGPLPDAQEKMLHLLDSVDYAANAGMVPAIACMGDRDPFFQEHVIMGEAMEREGLTLTNLIAPNTAHVIDPATQREELRRMGDLAAQGLNHLPRRIRFVTWTLKYSRCFWIELLGLGEHYARAEIDAQRDEEGNIDVKVAKNVTRLAIHAPTRRLVLEGTELRPPAGGKGPLLAGRKGTGWEILPAADLDGKRPGLQGPIEDAFTGRFLCVRGTRQPWNASIGVWSQRALRRFAEEWHRYFRGELPVKEDTAVTEEDLRHANLILFGDPGSNSWMSKVVSRLPIEWTRERVRVGATAWEASDHVPVLIYPNPLSPSRYVVLNSGHTFHDPELGSFNYLLFPRLADWAVVRVGQNTPDNAPPPMEEEVVAGGFFDERWSLAAKGR
jgi:pimeloyl-ACP methyl ester carboxylesterase